ncbi:MAG: ATP-binding protein, partial [Candidatus Acidiferrum sp.]
LGFHDGTGVAYFKDGNIRVSYGSVQGLGKGRVNALHLDPDGTLWAATEGGLSRLKNGHVNTLTARNGLPCDSVNWVIENDGHSFWLYMACGLVRIPRSEVEAWAIAVDKYKDTYHKVQATVFDTSDGVRIEATPEDFTPRVGRSPDGKLWFLPGDGVSVVDPRHLPFNKLPPPVHIEQVTADRKTYWQNLYSDTPSSPPRLPPLVRDLTIDYTALSLVVPEKVQFRVKLEGWDRDWKDAGNERKAFYSNLPPRKYRFRVMACNNSGVWNEAGTFLDFSIAPAYWQTNWFRAACVAAFMALLWVAYRMRVRVLEERQALLERQQVLSERHEGEISALNERLMKAQEEERIRIAGELHDGVLQRITAVSLRLGTAALQLPSNSEPEAEVRKVEKELIRVGAEIRQLSHELHPAVLHEKGLPDALSSYCEEFSTTRGIPISYEGDERVEELSPGVSLCIYRIAQEALGNVAKHAQAKQAKVRLTRSDDRVCLVVSDNGVGFDPDGSRNAGGLGLINMRERVRQLNGTFEFESQPGHGTTVKAEVPFRPAS